MNIFLDLETIPQQPEEEAKREIAETISPPANMSKPETIAQWHNGEGKYAGFKDKAVDDAYRKTSFDAAKGQICSISFAIVDSRIKSYSDRPERDIIGYALDDIMALCTKPLEPSRVVRQPFFIGHYIGNFDLKFLWQRAVILGIKPPFKVPFDGRHGKDYYCTMQAWCGYRDHISQDNLCKALGIEGKPNDIDGSKVWDFYKAGDIERIAEYNRDDVEKVRQIYKRLTFGV